LVAERGGAVRGCEECGAMGGVGEGVLPDVLQIDAFADVKRTHVRSNAAMRPLNENGC
jgi:hypothetical protein